MNLSFDKLITMKDPKIYPKAKRRETVAANSGRRRIMRFITYFCYVARNVYTNIYAQSYLMSLWFDCGFEIKLCKRIFDSFH